MAFVCFLNFFPKLKVYTQIACSLNTLPQLTVFTHPDEQKPYKTKLRQICAVAEREMPQPSAAMAYTRTLSIKYCYHEGKYHQILQGEAFGFCSSPQSLCIILRMNHGYRYPYHVLAEQKGHILQNNTAELR